VIPAPIEYASTDPALPARRRYVDRILERAKAAACGATPHSKFELVINLKTVTALGSPRHG
jgi:hypothetical protein